MAAARIFTFLNVIIHTTYKISVLVGIFCDHNGSVFMPRGVVVKVGWELDAAEARWMAISARMVVHHRIRERPDRR